MSRWASSFLKAKRMSEMAARCRAVVVRRHAGFVRAPGGGTSG